MTKLTTHVLDVYSGKPGKGIKVELFYINGHERLKLNSIVLNSDGRSDSPLVEVGLSIASVIYGAILGFFIIRLFNLKVTNHSVLLGFMISIISMIFIWRMSPLAWTWYVFTGTVIMLFISILLPYIKKIK